VVPLGLVVTAAASARAEDLVELQRAPEQGALVHGTAPPGSRLWLDGKSVRVEPDGAFVLGFGRGRQGDGDPGARRRQRGEAA